MLSVLDCDLRCHSNIAFLILCNEVPLFNTFCCNTTDYCRHRTHFKFNAHCWVKHIYIAIGSDFEYKLQIELSKQNITWLRCFILYVIKAYQIQGPTGIAILPGPGPGWHLLCRGRGWGRNRNLAGAGIELFFRGRGRGRDFQTKICHISYRVENLA